jgi:hypothetical protein
MRKTYNQDDLNGVFPLMAKHVQVLRLAKKLAKELVEVDPKIAKSALELLLTEEVKDDQTI